MLFEKYKIQSGLGIYVESIFYYKDFMPAHNIERVVPTGNIFILFEFDDFERKTYDRSLKPNGAYSKSWVSGMHQKHINISAHRHSEMLVVQFKPLGAGPFFKVPINELNDSIISSANYFGESVYNVRDMIMQTTSIHDKFSIVEKWLLQIRDESKSIPKELLETMTVLQEQPFSKHNELLKNYPKTKKHLIHQFKKYCGLTPKMLHRIFRFNKLLADINQKKEIVWSDIVYETGYTDQSHFIKEFKSFCGFSPSKYIKNGYNDSIPNFFPLDK